jgi:hypothetical protein
VTNGASVSTVDADFMGGERLAERAPAPTLRAFVAILSDERVQPMQKCPQAGGSTASVLQDYSEWLATEPSQAVLTFAAMDAERADRSRHARNAAVIALLDKWLAEDTDEDEAAWHRLKKRIEESRTSTRKRFSE